MADNIEITHHKSDGLSVEQQRALAFWGVFGEGDEIDVHNASPVSWSVMEWGRQRGYAEVAKRGPVMTTWRITDAGRRFARPSPKENP